ncbi:MAG TPA: glycosyl hydrolase family 18 protein, partial [Polyangiales bacterium]
MKLSPLAVCLALLTSACAPEEEAAEREPPWQESDSSVNAPSQGDGGAGLGADAGTRTDGGSMQPLREAGSSTSDGSSEQDPSRDAGSSLDDASASDSSSDAGGASPDAGATGRDDASVPAPPTKSGLVVGYYPAWATYDRNYQVAQIPGAKLTHVNYAFANIQDGRCVLGDAWADVQKTFAGDTWDESSASKAGNLKQLRKLKQANPALRTLISVGGWTWSTNFSDAAA